MGEYEVAGLVHDTLKEIDDNVCASTHQHGVHLVHPITGICRSPAIQVIEFAEEGAYEGV